MIAKDDYSYTSPLNEGVGAGIYNRMPYNNSNQYISSSPFGNVKVYDLDAQIEPIQRMQFGNNFNKAIPKNVGISEISAMEIPQIERMQIAPNVPNLANMDTYYKSLPSNVAISESQDTIIPTSTIAPITASKKTNYLLYGGAFVLVALVAYKLYKK